MSGHEATIVVDGTQHQWGEREISYEQVVNIAYSGSPPSGDQVQITVGYRRGRGNKPEGDLEPGQSVKVKDGMIFDVTATDRS
jgi:multiubiquitin